MLIGNGALANYHDLDEADRGDFERWHTTEHLPERVAVPGFMRGRRYRVVDGEPDYFILYEGSSVDVFCAPAYLERLNKPTPWTTQVSATMTRTLRTACLVTETMGQGTGDYCATWQLSPSGNRNAVRQQLVRAVFPVIGDISDILAVHLLEAVSEITTIETKEKSTRQSADEMSDWIVLIEADSTGTFAAVQAIINNSFHASLAQSEWAVYQLQALQRDMNEL